MFEIPDNISAFLRLDAPFWQVSLWGNTVFEYAVAGITFIGLIAVFKVIRMIVLSRLARIAQKTQTDVDDTVIDVFYTVRPPFYAFLAFFLAIQMITIAPLARDIINAGLIIWITAQVVVAAQILIDFAIGKMMQEDADGDGKPDPNVKTAASAIKILAKVILWSLALLMILSNLGVNVTSLVAGLGIGGVAVALALQNILGDLFSSFAIFFDKPFRPGDFIIVGENMGTVERIGIKTTRLRALDGEELVISNRELTSARIQNYKHMHDRRILFTFGVRYETSTEQLREIPGVVEGIIHDIQLTTFERAHFFSFDDSALTFAVVYYVNSGEYDAYMDAQQQINLRLKDALDERGIQIAYPTRTIYMHRVGENE